MPAAKFNLGQVYATPGALAAVGASGDDLLALLLAHATGDWGVVDADDKQTNDESLILGGRLLSAYLLKGGKRVWVITEAVGDDGIRPSTTALLPEEY